MTSRIAAVGWDAHRRFSQVTVRDAETRIVARRRIEHADANGRRYGTGTRHGTRRPAHQRQLLRGG